MPIPMLVIGPDRRVRLANDSFYNTFQVTRSDTEGRFIYELGNGQWNIPSLLTMLETVLNEGVPFRDFEVETSFPQIGAKYMILNATATRLAGGANTALLAIEDLTGRKLIADQLRQAEEKYRHLLENAHDGILVVDQDGVIEFANHRLEEMFGYSSGELARQPYDMLIPERYRESHNKFHDAFMRQPEPRDMGKGLDLFGRRKDGTDFPVEISLSPVKVDSKVMVTAIVRNISERKKIETERQSLLDRETDARVAAERASRVKDDFLSTLSHELRTPLTNILAWAQVLRLGWGDTEKAKRAVEVIEKSARDQGQLIDDLLDVSRIQAGKLLLDLRDIKATDCIVAAVESVRKLAEDRSIVIQNDFDSSACPIKADSSRMEQVLRNLLTNAIKFTPVAGKITVRTVKKRDPERVEIQVEDTGKGIKPEFLPHLFTRFSQEDSATTRGWGGLGLGLSIVRNLVEMHGGAVTAYSPGEGKGAVFTVTLPCVGGLVQQEDPGGASNKGQRNTQRTSKPVDLGGLRILAIDDLQDAREALSAMLQSCGAQAETAENVTVGLAALARFKPNVVLCDIAMPGEDGLSFIRKVRALKPGKGGKTPAIALTAFVGAEATRQSLEAGFDAHLAKPVDVADLSRLIAKLAGRLKK
jgi:PAS domain S-box-containing protein